MYSPLIVTFITTLTFPIYIRSISVLMFSINLGFLTITMRLERRQTIVIMRVCVETIEYHSNPMHVINYR